MYLPKLWLIFLSCGTSAAVQKGIRSQDGILGEPPKTFWQNQIYKR
ncbi:secreted protein [Rhodopirellula maiorica SM1]|uniref:Secreted protein n=1 Tax=Rhodopirellula maiorica SM1 TaxID=1265738 RepID=M5RAQ7_9BACT|nr:secreted protein [Rhodopirellula maiorica SM1]